MNTTVYTNANTYRDLTTLRDFAQTQIELATFDRTKAREALSELGIDEYGIETLIKKEATLKAWFSIRYIIDQGRLEAEEDYQTDASVDERIFRRIEKLARGRATYTGRPRMSHVESAIEQFNREIWVQIFNLITLGEYEGI